MANNLGLALMGLGRAAEARPCFPRALAIKEKAFGAGSPTAEDSRLGLGRTLLQEGRAGEALVELRRALAMAEEAQASGDRDPGEAHRLVAPALRALGRLDEARAEIERAQAVYDRRGGPADRVVGRVLAELGEIDEARRDHAGATKALERAVPLLAGDAADAAELAAAELALAQSLWAGGAIARAVSLVAGARDRYAALGPGFAADRTAAERWLGAHRP